MTPIGPSKPKIWIGRVLSALIVAGAIGSGIAVLYHTNRYPRTDDCEVLANFIGIAPQVEGPLIHLNVHDNQFVKKERSFLRSTRDRTGTPWSEQSPIKRLWRDRFRTSGEGSRPW
jgi:hypothetical protein